LFNTKKIKEKEKPKRCCEEKGKADVCIELGQGWDVPKGQQMGLVTQNA